MFEKFLFIYFYIYLFFPAAFFVMI